MPGSEPFEKYTREYEDWFEKNRRIYEIELETVRSLIYPPGAGGLEVGVGSGRFASPLKVATGVDPSLNMLAEARDRGVRVCAGVAEQLPFAPKVFSFILMVTTICFVDDINLSFREAGRVLKPGGYIIVGFVDRESELGRQYEENKENSKFYREATFFSTLEVLDFLEDAGFKNFESRQTILSGSYSEEITSGSGEGAFVAVRGEKQR